MDNDDDVGAVSPQAVCLYVCEDSFHTIIIIKQFMHFEC